MAEKLMEGSRKTEEDIATLREGGRRLALILEEIIKKALPGVSTFELDVYAERLILEGGGSPAFKGYRVQETKRPYPATLCISVNDEVVHAIPRRDKVLKEGDVAGLDIGMRWPDGQSQKSKVKSQKFGLYTDMARTVGVGKISQDAERLIRTTREALGKGISAVHHGAHTGDIGHAVALHLRKEKLGVIRNLAGHGVGYALHEEPLIPNYGAPGTGPELVEGMVIAIEPMATLGGWKITLDKDEWTFRTQDRSLAAHFEATIVVTKNGAEVLTPLPV